VEEGNNDEGNMLDDVVLFKWLIERISVELYTQPLVKIEASKLTDDKQLIDDTRAAGERTSGTVEGILKQLAAGWMQLMMKKMGVPMVRSRVSRQHHRTRHACARSSWSMR
jgi:hypothetical protein